MVRVTSSEPGSVYLIGIDSTGAPYTLSVGYPGNEVLVAPDRPALLPVEPPLLTRTVSAPTSRRVIVLIRRSAGKPSPRAAAFAAPQPAPEMPSSTPAVEVLECGVAVTATETRAMDAGVDYILRTAASVPPGSWIAKEIAVSIQPASAE